MSFVAMKEFEISQPLKAAHFDFPRAQVLRQAFVRCVTDYYTKMTKEGSEARGLIITGHSRVGRSQETKKLIADFNESKTPMPDGRPAKIVSCVLSGRVSGKDLGIQTLNALGYELQSTRTQSYIWERVLEQAKRQGVIGFHYDECQHVFIEGAKSNTFFLDSFKSMMKEPRWPLMLILSGVPDLRKFVQPYEQLSNLLDPVHFEEININQDIDLLCSLLFAFADKAGIEMEQLSTPDFLQRIDFACSHRWGLVIELTIEALVSCAMASRTELDIDDFVKVYAVKTGVLENFSPFTDPDYTESFDPARLLGLFGEK